MKKKTPINSGIVKKIVTLTNLSTGKTHSYKKLKANGGLKGLVKKGNILKIVTEGGLIEFSKVTAIRIEDKETIASLDVFQDNLEVMKAIQEQKDAVAPTRRKRS